MNAPDSDGAYPSAWDMRTFLEERESRKLPEHAYEACELLITHGARRHFQANVGSMVADPSLKAIFPDEATSLIRLLDKNEKSKLEGDSGRSCAVM